MKSEHLKNAAADLAEADHWLDLCRKRIEVTPELEDLMRAVAFVKHATEEILAHFSRSGA
jgi:hypothetical protein